MLVSGHHRFAIDVVFASVPTGSADAETASYYPLDAIRCG